MTRFTPLVENNDHEGETWTWWIQVDGNEAVLDSIASVLREAREADAYFEQYDLATWPDGETLTESEVDLLVRWSDGGYYAAHNFVVGTLVLPSFWTESVSPFERLEVLYKGGIDDWDRA